MLVELKFITPAAENFIGEMAGICYDANLSPEANVKRAAKCARDGHLSTLRFASAVFHISGISRICSHQMVRSKHLDFLQRSQRYCKELSSKVVEPIMDQQQEAEYFSAIISSQQAYERLLQLGMKKEDARFVLPEATNTELNVVGNLQAWQDFIKLRSTSAAQWEIREVAKQINNLLAKECPNLFHWSP